ncbi:MAG: LysR family transcriptional regulator, partial [Sarcina sp.]
MQIDSLKYFYEVATLKSISKAAHNSHISQSALSQQLLKLEEKLGVKLLERSNKGVELTPEGEVLLKYSIKILNNFNSLNKEIIKVHNKDTSLDIQSSCVISDYLVNKSLSKIFTNFNEFNINITLTTHDKSYSNLLHNLCDIMVTSKEVVDCDLISSHLGSDYYILVAKKDIHLKNIYDYPLLVLKNKFINENTISNYFSDFKTIVTTNSLTTVNQYLSNLSIPIILFIPKLYINTQLINNQLILIDN